MKKLHGIRYVVLLLCLLLALAAFAACDSGNTPGETSTGEDSTSGNDESSSDSTATENEIINVSQYSLLVSDNADDPVENLASTLIVAIQKKSGAELASFGTDFSVTASDYEILLGSTNREESAAVLADLNGALGYVIKKVGGKIVINASTPYLLDEAVQYFINTYLASAANGTFEIPLELCYVNSDINGVALLDANGECRYDLVISDKVDTSADDRNRTDYSVSFFSALRTALQNSTDADYVDFATDDISSSAESYEILLGRTNREESESFLQSLAPNEYGYTVIGNKIVITGWSELTIAKAAELFTADLENYIYTDVNGYKNLILLETDRTVVAYESWDTSFPMYESGSMSGVVELYETGSYELNYTNTTADEYKAYRSTLETAGYKLQQENAIGSNLYSTYYNDKTMIHVYYVDYCKTVRVVTAPMTSVVLPQQTDPNLGKKITDVSFTMFDLDEKNSNFGNSFIITLEDGSFIMCDGGGDKSYSSNSERDMLYELLCSLNKREDGKIVIAAWMISHEHWDHFKNAYDMFMYTPYMRNITIERLIYNVPSPSVRENSYNPNEYVSGIYMKNIIANYGCEMVAIHTGQKIQIRNLTLECLYTLEDIYPNAIELFNNSSLIIRFNVSDGTTTQRFTLVGDIQDVGSNIASKMYGDELKTDILQVAHHGYGGTVELYRYFKPTIVVWPKSQSVVNTQLSSTQTGYYPTINQSLISQKNVKLLVVADNGNKTLVLPMTDISESAIIVTYRSDGR